MERDRLSHIIFDLGGVLIGLDTMRTLDAFKSLAPDTGFNWSTMYHHPLALRYEQGLISDEEFRSGLREVLQIGSSDSQIDDAWNAMILDFPEDRFDLLSELSSRYKILLLSNTNAIHMQYVGRKIRELGYDSLDQHFHRAHYSYLMNMRKPDPVIYETVLSEHGLNPAQALFIDDNPHNIASAGKLGIRTHHLTDINSLGEFIRARLL